MEKIIIKKLTKEILEKNIKRFIDILSDIPDEYWKSDHFLLELPSKWSFSLYATNNLEQIIGYIIASYKDFYDSIHINKFMIDKRFRGQNIGTLMLEHFENKCKTEKKNLITLKVKKSNYSAICFYLKNNFKIHAEHSDYLLMKKDLG